MKRLIRKSEFDINNIKNSELKEMLENNKYDDGQSHRSEAGIYINGEIYTGMIHTDAIMDYILSNPDNSDVQELTGNGSNYGYDDEDNDSSNNEIDEREVRDEIGDGRNLDMPLSFFDICDSDEGDETYIVYFAESAGPIEEVYNACKESFGNIRMFIVTRNNTLKFYK